MLRQEQASESETVLVVAGSLFGEAGVEFEKMIDGLAATSYQTVTLDLSMALGITSSAIGKLLSLHKKLREKNKKLRIGRCSDVLFSIFRKIKLDTLIQIAN